jgi:hypothetical protein
MKIKMLFVMSIEEEAAMLRMRRAALLTSNRSYLPYLLELLYFRYDMRMSRAGSAGPVDAMRFERKNNEKSVVGWWHSTFDQTEKNLLERVDFLGIRTKVFREKWIPIIPERIAKTRNLGS